MINNVLVKNSVNPLNEFEDICLFLFVVVVVLRTPHFSYTACVASSLVL